ncbi:type 4a pilus biogenesis protein PilO [Thalassotalea aquiviva]|uniref:type 4a pilus biogenesis protein PilO n=1 Tax=Thalassotalea aquiviva TaxID=3242415 RepID=UPI00352AA934
MNMNIDLSQFDDLELNNIAQWPKAAKVLLAVVMVCFVSYAVYYILVSDKISELEREIAKESKLKSEYQKKYFKSANLELFIEQMEEAEELFAKQVKRLPESNETPGLLDDITYVGTTSRLEFQELDWQPEVELEIYVELPIEMQVTGSYHDFGEFSSKISGLPRIVTLHDFTITSSGKAKDNDMTLKLQAKTYKYKEGK